jgi:NADP-dependent 3-hydroxy acid dehydrogenase YdfG
VDRRSGGAVVAIGGARGIASERLFAEVGARVVIAGIQEDRGREVAREIGDAARLVPCDVTEESAREGVVDAAVIEWSQPTACSTAPEQWSPTLAESRRSTTQPRTGPSRS